MSCVTVIWSMAASACLTVAAMHLLILGQNRAKRAHALFSLAAIGIAVVSMVELGMMRAATPEQFAALVRWYHVPAWVVIVSLVGFVRLYLQAGRPWLGWSVCGLRTLSLLLNFTTGQNLNFREVVSLSHVTLLGEPVSVGLGMVNPWVVTGQLSQLLLAVFAADAAVVTWRRGNRRRALTVGGSIVFFPLFGTVSAVLVSWGLAPMPIVVSLAFLGLVVAVAWELSQEAIRAAQLGDDLRESESRYRGIFDGAVEGMFRTSAEGKLLVANAAMARMLGYGSADEAVREIADTSQQVWAEPDERARYVRTLEEHGAVRAYECHFKRKDGTRIWVSLSTRAVRGPDEKTAYLDGFVEDITGRRRAEEALRQNRLRLATGADLAGLGFYELGEGEHVTYLDDRVRDICGIPSDESRSVSPVQFWLEHIHPDDFACVLDRHRRMHDGREDRVSIDFRYLHPGGRETWIQLLAVVTERDAARRRVREIGAMRDVTQEKRATAELAESEERLRQAAEAAGFGIYHYNLLSGQAFYSPEFLSLYGLPEGSALELDADLAPKAVHPDDKAVFVARMHSANDPSGPGVFDVEFRIRRPDGEVRWLRSRGRTCFDGAGRDRRPVRSNGIIQDVTEQRQAELEHQRSRAEITHLSRVIMLGELSGSIAHELNQPLAAILSNAQAAQRFLAEDGVDLNEIREILADIVADDRRAGEVIRRLRVLLKKGEANHEPLDLDEVVQDVLRLIRNDLLNHDVVLSTDLAAGRVAVMGDRVQLQQVLLNLIVNSIDAMAPLAAGERRLAVRTALATEGTVRVSVSDSGMGLAPEVERSMFNAFFTTKPSGMGMGLKVCRTIIDTHGGVLHGANNAGRGAIFYFTLPVLVAQG